MSKKLSTSILIAVLSAAIAAGCGGGDGDGGDSDAATTLPTPTVASSSIGKAEFTKQANQICLQAAEGVEAPVGKALESKKGETIERGEDAFLRMVEGVIGEIGQLGAPAGEKAQVEALLVSLQKAYNASAEASSPSMARLGREFQQPGKVASANGLSSCVFS